LPDVHEELVLYAKPNNAGIIFIGTGTVCEVMLEAFPRRGEFNVLNDSAVPFPTQYKVQEFTDKMWALLKIESKPSRIVE
jgi:hypothetical protein